MAKLQDCELAGVAAVSYPFAFARPESDWEDSFNRGNLPESIFKFYCAASFFSIGSEPRFLQDPDRVLFGYLKAVVSGIRESLDEAAQLVDAIRAADARQYTPLKAIRGESWDAGAGYAVRRDFKYLVAELSGVLDQFAEVAAILFYGHIPKVPIGKADFARLVDAANRRSTPKGIVSAQDGQVEKLLAMVQNHVTGVGPEEQWFEMFQLYRNKLAHLGNYMLPAIGLPHKTADSLHTFLPNHWPAVMESQISTGRPGPAVDLPTLLTAELIHQDLVEYSERLTARVRELVGDGFGVLLESYKLFRDLDPASGVIDGLNRQRIDCRFRYFED